VTERHPEATLSEPYSLIRGLMELPEGNVMIADQRENALYLASFEGSERQTLGGQGQGPHEYASLVGLFAGSADTACAYDLKNTRSLKRRKPGSDDAHRTVVMGTDGSGGIDTVATLETPGLPRPHAYSRCQPGWCGRSRRPTGA